MSPKRGEVDALRWQKSSFSGGGEGNDCLELASSPTHIHLRESDTPTSTLTTTPATLAHLLAFTSSREVPVAGAPSHPGSPLADLGQA